MKGKFWLGPAWLAASLVLMGLLVWLPAAGDLTDQPPTGDTDMKTTSSTPPGPPALDRVTPAKVQTATFALG